MGKTPIPEKVENNSICVFFRTKAKIPDMYTFLIQISNNNINQGSIKFRRKSLRTVTNISRC